MGGIGPLAGGASRREERAQPCALRLEQGEQLALERAVADGLAAEVVQVEDRRIV
jgi:hypothetical protein